MKNKIISGNGSELIVQVGAQSTLPWYGYYLIITLLAVLMLCPAFVLGAGGFDLMCQSLWVKHFSTEFWQGYLYPRWMVDMYAGNGSTQWKNA